MRRLFVVAAAAAALVAPADAFAHATLVRTVPANGAVLARAPHAVTVVFDDTVRVAGGNAAVANDTRASVLAGKASAHGRTLTIPLEPLHAGAYSVRWAIVSDDGHTEKGVLAFAVGSGSASPQSVLGASVALTWNDILLRTLYYLGLLVAGGATVFGLAQAELADRLRRPLSQLLFFSLLAAFIGASGITGVAPPGTRFDHVLKAAILVALVGGAAAALVPSAARLYPVAQGASLLLLLAPTLSGHALDRNEPFLLAPLVDFAHLAGAAVWLGGLAALLYALPRAGTTDEERGAAVRRFSSTALAAVAVIGVTGLGRALMEVSAVSQAWSTSYGRALLVKTAIFVPLLGVGWLNRSRLLDTFARLRRSMRVEVLAIAGIVVAVAILTELRPGKDAQRPVPVAALPPVLPPRDAVVDARELGDLAVAIARQPHATTVTIVSPDATGVDGKRVEVDGVAATPCGSGCYRAPAGARVTVDGQPLSFDAPPAAPNAAKELARITAAYRASRTIVFDETLASTPTNASVTRFVAVAPHRLSYDTRDGGASARVIGGRRWDRTAPGARWVESSQTPLDVTQPIWSAPTNVHEVSPGTFTFLDRSIPAWFRLTVSNGRPVVDHMTAAAHFMVDRYVGFDISASVSPPPSR